MQRNMNLLFVSPLGSTRGFGGGGGVPVCANFAFIPFHWRSLLPAYQPCCHTLWKNIDFHQGDQKSNCLAKEANWWHDCCQDWLYLPWTNSLNPVYFSQKDWCCTWFSFLHTELQEWFLCLAGNTRQIWLNTWASLVEFNRATCNFLSWGSRQTLVIQCIYEHVFFYMIS